MSYLSKLKITIAKKIPFTAVFSRFIKALFYSISTGRKTYSQHGEDIFIWDLLNREFPNCRYNFIDVGAFHPILLSNTFLLYKRHVTGITIEPNKELARLHRLFRPKDIQIEIACSNENSIGKFYLQRTFPALSSLENSNKSNKIEYRYVPILTLDTLYEKIDFTKIFFLSIDVEGVDFQVLQGAEMLLKNTFIVCIEFNNSREEQLIRSFLTEMGFVFLRSFSCNMIFKNEYFSAG